MPDPTSALFARRPAWAGAIALLLAACAGPSGPPGPAALPVPETSAPRLAGSSWYWLGSVTPMTTFAPSDPGSYNVEFLDGGQAALQLDCNRGTASWKQSGNRLEVGPVAGTRKMCAAGSDGERFGRQLQSARSARVVQGLLEVELAGDSGTMTLARDPDARLRSFECSGVAPIVVAFGRSDAVVRWQGSAWTLKQQVTASGTRYGADSVILFSKGNEATLLRDGKQVAGPCVARR
jgi:heat shock protein HslJ